MRKKDLDYLKNDDIDIGTHINNMRLCLLLELFIFIITVVLLLTYLSWFETYFWKKIEILILKNNLTYTVRRSYE